MFWRQVLAQQLEKAPEPKRTGRVHPLFPQLALEGTQGDYSFSGNEPKRLFRQATPGVFEECAFAEGFDSRLDGRSLVAADLDGDGAVDLVLLNRNEPRLQLFHNRGPVGHSLELSLRATRGAAEAAGAVVHAREGSSDRAFPVLLQRGYASSVPPRVHVGLGTRSSTDVWVLWRAGALEPFGRLAAGARYELVEGEGKPRPGVAYRPGLSSPGGAFPSSLSALGLAPDGRPSVVSVFASWCKPCAQEAPALNRIHQDGRFRVVGLGAHPASEIAGAAAKLGIRYPVLALPSSVQRALTLRGALGLPLALYFDARGALVRVGAGKTAFDPLLRELFQTP